MAKIYAKRIKAGLMTLDQVPDKWRAETGLLLTAQTQA